MSADWLEAKMSREDAARFQYRILPSCRAHHDWLSMLGYLTLP